MVKPKQGPRNPPAPHFPPKRPISPPRPKPARHHSAAPQC